MTDQSLRERLLACPNPWCSAFSPASPVALKYEGWRVLCSCGVSTPRYDTEAEATDAWNVRGSTNGDVIEKLNRADDYLIVALTETRLGRIADKIHSARVVINSDVRLAIAELTRTTAVVDKFEGALVLARQWVADASTDSEASSYSRDLAKQNLAAIDEALATLRTNRGDKA